MNSYFELLEKIVLSVLIVCTIIAIGMEIQDMIAVYKVTLADILLLFIYIEIIGMIKEYWVSKMIRMSYPLFIAMTALARMIIMQRKDVDPSAYVYESLLKSNSYLICLKLENIMKQIEITVRTDLIIILHLYYLPS